MKRPESAPSPRQARWNEPLIFELDREGQRGLAVIEPDPEIDDAIGDALATIPAAMRRMTPPALPRLSQPEVVTHFLRLSQETLGVDLGNDLGVGTCTMKYNPKVNDRLVRARGLRDLHPLQPAETVQGALAIMWSLDRILCSLSGMSQFSFQPGGGTAGIFTNACIIRAFHERRGAHRDEMITTALSHPGNAGAASTAGYKVVTLYPSESGLPSIEALKAAVSDRTAGLMITNPEDTGLFNGEIDRFVEVVHDAGGLCSYDQANANGLLGITRARDAGFDLCQFNLHKTFGSPHGAAGLACGAVGASEQLAGYLPTPVVRLDEGCYFLDYARPASIGKVRAYYGVVPTVVRAYAWVLSLGPEGLRTVAETAVLNSRYLAQKLASIPGLSVPFAGESGRLEQVRYSWERLTEETGVTTLDIARRLTDFGLATYFASHHPWLVNEPMTIEPVESTARPRIDAFIDAVAEVASEAESDADRVIQAPWQSTIGRLDQAPLEDPEQWASTWRAHVRKRAAGT